MSKKNETDNLIISYLCDDLRPGLVEDLGELLVHDAAARTRFTLLARQDVLLRRVFQAGAIEPSVVRPRQSRRLLVPFALAAAASYVS